MLRVLIFFFLVNISHAQVRDSLIMHYNDLADEWERSNYDSSLYYAQLAVDLSREIRNKDQEIRSLNNLGYSLASLSRYNEAYGAHQMALSLAHEIQSESQIAKTQNFIGVYYNELADYAQALEHMLISYEMRVKLHDTVGMSIVGGNIGLNYYRLKQYELAEKYLKETVRIDSTLGDSLYMIGSLINIGLVYKHTDRLDRSEEVTQRALVIAKDLNSESDVALILGNLGMIYIQAEDYSKAEEFLSQSMALRRRRNFPRELLRTHANLARLYTDWNRFPKALSHVDSASHYNAIVHNARQQEKILSIQMDAYKKMGRFAKAFQVNDALMKLRDSLSNEERLNKLASVEGRLNLLEKENELVRQEGDIAKLTARNQRLAFGGAGLLGLLGLAYLFRSRAYSRRNAALHKQYAQDLIASTEEERKRISSELHDSIGQSLLLIKNKILLNPSEVKDDIGIVDDAISEVRSISQALHPYQFEKLGLLRSLEYLIEQFQANSNIFYSCDIEVGNGELTLEENQGIYIYRIFQECINNVEKHSGAKACNLTVSGGENGIIFRLRDNGKGFDLTENSALLNSLGMKTLRERAQIIGAQLEIDSTAGKGTTITLRIA